MSLRVLHDALHVSRASLLLPGDPRPPAIMFINISQIKIRWDDRLLAERSPVSLLSL